MAEQHTGVVVRFNRKRLFGFVVVVDESPQRDVFFHKDDVLRDSVGRYILEPETSVAFRIISRDGRERAVEVRSLDLQVDPEIYFENSTVRLWDAVKRSGYLLRPDGSSLYFWGGDIQTIGEDLLRPGMQVKHQIVRDRMNGRDYWKATNIEIYREDAVPDAEQTIEEYFESLPDSSRDVPEPVEQPSALLTTENKKKTLLEEKHEA